MIANRNARGAAIGFVIVAVATSCHSSSGGRAGSPPTSAIPTARVTVEPRPFQVAPPSGLFIGGVDGHITHCLPSQLSGHARLRPTVGGVAGVINLRGTDCPIPVRGGIVSLLGADHTKLAVPVLRHVTNLAEARNPRGILAYPAGAVSEGFLWRGSWCGAAAAGLRMQIGSHLIEVPVSGPQPGCDGTSHSEVNPGTWGPIGARVQGAPFEWRLLRTEVQFPFAINRPVLKHPRLTFSNDTSVPITLQPTPAYAVDIYEQSNHIHANDEFLHRLPLTSSAVVPAHGSLTITLPNLDLSRDWALLRGDQLTITVEIAGAPIARGLVELEGNPLHDVRPRRGYEPLDTRRSS